MFGGDGDFFFLRGPWLNFLVHFCALQCALECTSDMFKAVFFLVEVKLKLVLSVHVPKTGNCCELDFNRRSVNQSLRMVIYHIYCDSTSVYLYLHCSSQ